MRRIGEQLEGAVLHYDGTLLDSGRHASLFASLRSEIPWGTHSIKMFGRVVQSPRLSSWHGDPGATYRYSGLHLEPRAWTPSLLEAKELVESALDREFNSVLANLYRDGDDAMGWHADDEPELGENPSIASLSLGATRRFTLKHRQRAELRLAVELEPGSLLVMSGSTQRDYKHALPRTKRAVGPRINLTFRSILL